jgi:hypothetical protein
VAAVVDVAVSIELLADALVGLFLLSRAVDHEDNHRRSRIAV